MVSKDEVIACPVNRGTWEEVAENFRITWDLPHSFIEPDGKHIAIRSPNTGTMYHNYKGFFSFVTVALVDGDYKFMWIGICGLGCQSDAQIYNKPDLKECLENGR
ncbi:hypothetical protein HOLleu_23860 [Holothuria leucospilota]|uniref:DDE Tnp4 domain-containing protein n=1 Tax=Holothuria leucospilota TaxID=206669 RepID=A0A9Q1H5V3_HOLLE|nr:hypothetical protein HOLleu_23860 [Holothuria leucospilota]